jgi:putative endonuclease
MPGSGYSFMPYYVYILAKRRNSTFYTGVTNDLIRRVWEHKEGIIKGFTWKYDVKQLVYYEVFDDIREAIRREKQIKKWTRKIKMEAIERMNPEWKDLYYEIIK